MRYFVDTEFVEDGRTIDLISIGIVAEDGREYYAQSTEFAPEKASDWVQHNVFPHLAPCGWDCLAYDAFQPQKYVAQELRNHRQGQCRDRNGHGVAVCFWRTRAQIRDEVRAFVNAGSEQQVETPEFVAWCGAYDWVALCQLFGTMMDLPEGWPHSFREVQQVLDERSIRDQELPQQPASDPFYGHNALGDARHLQTIWHYLYH